MRTSIYWVVLEVARKDLDLDLDLAQGTREHGSHQKDGCNGH